MKIDFSEKARTHLDKKLSDDGIAPEDYVIEETDIVVDNVKYGAWVARRSDDTLIYQVVFPRV